MTLVTVVLMEGLAISSRKIISYPLKRNFWRNSQRECNLIAVQTRLTSSKEQTGRSFNVSTSTKEQTYQSFIFGKLSPVNSLKQSAGVLSTCILSKSCNPNSALGCGLLVGVAASVVCVESSQGRGCKEELRSSTGVLDRLICVDHLHPLSQSVSSRNQDNERVEGKIMGLSSFISCGLSRRKVAHMEAMNDRPVQDSTTTSKDIYLTRHAIADAAAKAAPAVVNITVSIGGRGIYFAQTGGSGFIISPDGTILTNAHVVADDGHGPYKGKIVVTMQDGRTFPGEIINYDSLADIAVVRVHSTKPLPTVSFGSSRKLRPGEWVVALGSPLHLQNTVTVGIVSCVDRKSAEMGLRGVHADYIQTDAAINQGNSGGPLLNLDGEVIGINTMKALAADGVSFAIPIDSALKIINQLKKHGRVVRPWLGMKMLELTEDIILQLKERDPSFPDLTRGVLVPQVIPGSPAERAGVRAGDVVVQFDGQPVNSIHQIVEALGDQVGVAFKLVVRRSKGATATLSVVTEEASPSF